MPIKFYEDVGDAPGFLGWIATVTDAVQRVTAASDQGVMQAVKALHENAFDIFAPFVQEPTDPDEVRRELFALSANQLFAQFGTVKALVGNPDPKSEGAASSGTGSEADAGSASPGSTSSGRSPSGSGSGRPRLKRVSASAS